MLKRLSLVAAAGLLGVAAFTDFAEADECRALEMRLMQAQAGGNSAQLRSAHNLLIDRGCRSGRRIAKETKATPEPRRARARARTERARTATARRSPERSERRQTQVASGTFRTLCVRSCDGYYFPISFSTTRKHFEADQARCREMCPAGEAGLYYHQLGSEGPQDMLSLEGALYSALPTAFSYRAAVDRSCGCGATAAAAALFGAGGPDAVRGATALRPKARPAPGEDPETLANRAGDFVPAALDPVVAAADRQSPTQVRLVGPTEAQPVVLTEIPN